MVSDHPCTRGELWAGTAAVHFPAGPTLPGHYHPRAGGTPTGVRHPPTVQDRCQSAPKGQLCPTHPRILVCVLYGSVALTPHRGSLLCTRGDHIDKRLASRL